ncbi:MAG TPA: rhodanese-like domain-containing protein [Calditrichia bacterium]|nr:rhodanese-like domain-containing protein [Calditrichota bacterium]HQU70747.1 rhodanese-like domain-containing protein [Calditrichia bacterium]HQV31054.1 rhodanese-like domain-containing protein [Calditrichia bacterium]
MIKLTKILISAVTILSLVGCNGTKTENTQTVGNTVQPKVRDLGVAEVQKMIQDNPGIIRIDVRTPGEYTGELGHIAGTDLKTVQTIEEWGPKLNLPKDQPIILICRSGNRSGHAARALAQMGYLDLVNMSGGMLAWNQAGYPVEK